MKKFLTGNKQTVVWGQVWILKQVDLFSSQHYQSLLCDSTSLTCFFIGVTWIEHLIQGEKVKTLSLYRGALFSYWGRVWATSYVICPQSQPNGPALPWWGPPGREWQISSTSMCRAVPLTKRFYVPLSNLDSFLVREAQPTVLSLVHRWSWNSHRQVVRSLHDNLKHGTLQGPVRLST